MNIKKLLTTFVMTFVVLLSGCATDDFNEVIGVCPVVVSTNPDNGAVAIPLDQVITVTFNEEMDPSTITAASFTLRGTAPVAGTVTYSGTTATFTPAAPLAFNTTYSARMSTAAQDVNGNALQSDYTFTFSTGPTLSPMVVFTDPANAATNVFLNKIVDATFNIPMDPATINGTTFMLNQGTTPIAGAVTYVGNTAYFNPTLPLAANTVYTATITTDATNLQGTPLAANYVWSFTTGTISGPMVISTDPINGAVGVALDKTPTANFNMAMNPLTVNSGSFTLQQGATAIAGVVTYLGTTASFNPTVDLLPNTVYTATITTAVQNVTGTAIASNYVWTFKTGIFSGPQVISTDPTNGALSVALNKTATATFNMAMNAATINNTSFTLKKGTTAVAGVVSYLGTTASFDPTVDLLPNSVYTATITTAVQNTTGTAILANYVWSFTTVSTAIPVVVVTNPLNNASGATLTQNITAGFNMAMDPTTINALSFTLKQGLTPITGIVSYLGTTATFNPTVNLAANQTYTATITTLAKSAGGVALANNYVWTFNTNTSAVSFIDLRTVARFGIIAGVGVSNNAGFSEIHDLDVGISPGVRSSITGFPPAVIVNGAIYASNDSAAIAAMLAQAKLDLTAAYLQAEGASAPAPQTVSGDLGGLTLAPGIYKSTSTLAILNGNLTLDAQGDPNAFWVFQIASAFTTTGGAGGSVILAGGAQAKNITWQTGSSATIGNYTTFKGNVLALQSITMGSHATAQGRMLARNAAVVMTDTNIITKP